MTSTDTTPTPTSREPDAGVAFDPLRPAWTRDGREVQNLHDDPTRPEERWIGRVAGEDHLRFWIKPSGLGKSSSALDLTNVPPPSTPERADAGQVEGDAAFVERMDRTLRPDWHPSEVYRLLALARRGASLPASSAPQVDAREGAKPVEWRYRNVLSLDGWHPVLFGSDDPDRVLKALVDGGYEVQALYAAPPPRPDPATDAAPPPRPNPATDGGWREAILAEREACAKLVEVFGCCCGVPGRQLAASIRNRPEPLSTDWLGMDDVPKDGKLIIGGYSDLQCVVCLRFVDDVWKNEAGVVHMTPTHWKPYPVPPVHKQTYGAGW